VLTAGSWLLGRGWRWVAIALFLSFFTLTTTSLHQLAPTFDEQGFLVRGLGYIRGENQHMRVGHPLGLNAWNALLLRDDSTVALPLDHPSWQETGFHRPAELFLWELGNDVAHIMFASRIMTIFLGLLLLAVVTRWARQVSPRPWFALLVLTVAAFDPNLLAHSRLNTTDAGLALGTAVSAYTLWLALRQPHWQTTLLAGAGFALLANTKFTMGLFVPLFALVILLTWAYQLWLTPANRPHTLRHIAQFILLYPTSAFLTLWAMYGFQISTLPDNLPALPQLSGLTLPLAHHLEQLLDIGNRAQQGAPAFLLGEYRTTGWWYYFPVAFLLKTPLPTLFLLLLATVAALGAGWRWLRQSPRPAPPVPSVVTPLMLLVPPLGYMGIALTTTVNLGYRHLLPLWPFLWVWLGYGLARWGWVGGRRVKSGYTAVFLPLLLLISHTLALHPHYLAYFNALAGGPDNGWQFLADSNLDWGQELPRLAQWQQETGAGPIWLSYFGEARPDYYGLDYRGLDSFPPRLMNPYANPFYPPDPAPGLYAISATNLVGVHFQNPAQFAWFRDQKPVQKFGYALFLYDVPAYGERTNLLLANNDLATVPTTLWAHLKTNDVVPRWFDLTSSFVYPNEGGWLVVPEGQEGLSSVPNWGEIEVVDTAVSRILYRLAPLQNPPYEFPLAEFNHANLYDFVPLNQAENQYQFRTMWQVTNPPAKTEAVRIFVHALNENGEIISQSDVLDFLVEGWQTGDWFSQTHTLTLPEGEGIGDVSAFRIGLYNPNTGEQLGEPITMSNE
jgi:hypothetical protein